MVNDDESNTTNVPSPEAHLPYKVGKTPKQKLMKEFKSTVMETFFADDPLRQFKDQSRSTKFKLAIQSVFPIFDWGRDYNLQKFKGDLIAGLTIASLCIPQDIGYSNLANLPPQYGLCKQLDSIWSIVF